MGAQEYFHRKSLRKKRFETPQQLIIVGRRGESPEGGKKKTRRKKFRGYDVQGLRSPGRKQRGGRFAIERTGMFSAGGGAHEAIRRDGATIRTQSQRVGGSEKKFRERRVKRKGPPYHRQRLRLKEEEQGLSGGEGRPTTGSGKESRLRAKGKTSLQHHRKGWIFS